jgi:hypothetical protein
MAVSWIQLQRRVRLLRLGVFALCSLCGKLLKHDFDTSNLHGISNIRKHPSKPYKPKVHSDVITYTFYLLTYSTEHSPSWETNRFWTSQEFFRILWNSKDYYRIHKCPSPVPILSQIDPFHTPHPTFWRSILILSSYLCLNHRSGLFPHQNPVYTSNLPHTCCMPRPSHSSRFDHPNNISRRVQTVKLLIK